MHTQGDRRTRGPSHRCPTGASRVSGQTYPCQSCVVLAGLELIIFSDGDHCIYNHRQDRTCRSRTGSVHGRPRTGHRLVNDSPDRHGQPIPLAKSLSRPRPGSTSPATMPTVKARPAGRARTPAHLRRTKPRDTRRQAACTPHGRHEFDYRVSLAQVYEHGSVEQEEKPGGGEAAKQRYGRAERHTGDSRQFRYANAALGGAGETALGGQLGHLRHGQRLG